MVDGRHELLQMTDPNRVVLLSAHVGFEMRSANEEGFFRRGMEDVGHGAELASAVIVAVSSDNGSKRRRFRVDVTNEKNVA